MPGLRIAAAFCLIASLLALGGCYSRVRDTGFLEGGYTDFNAVDRSTFKLRLDDGEYAPLPELPALLAENDSATTRGVLFVIPEVEWAAAKPFPSDDPEKLEFTLFTVRERFYRYLLRAYPAPTRVRFAYRATDPVLKDHMVITLKSRVTDYTAGWGFARYFIGYIGESRIQIEGEIFEGPFAERKIGEFAIRRGNAGYAQMGLNTKVLKTDYCLLYAAEEAIATMSLELPEHIAGVVTGTEKRAVATAGR